MKLSIVKLISEIMTLIGIVCIFLFTIKGNMMYGWLIFVAMMLISGVLGYIFFRCPHCKKPIPINGNQNQKYCPYCHEELGMKMGPFSYYSKCTRRKKGTVYSAYTLIGPATAIVTILILELIVIAIMGMDGVKEGIGPILLAAAAIIGLLIGLFSRCIAGSAAKLDETYLSYAKLPFIWKKYKLSDIRETSEETEPFYHITRGIVCAADKNVITIPVATYKGGEEFMQVFTNEIGLEPIDIDPEKTVTKHGEEGKRDEERFREFIYNVEKEKKEEE